MPDKTLIERFEEMVRRPVPDETLTPSWTERTDIVPAASDEDASTERAIATLKKRKAFLIAVGTNGS